MTDWTASAWQWSEPRKRRWLFAVLAALALVLAGWSIFPGGPAKNPAPPAVPVTVATATRQDVPLAINEIGAAQAWTSVTILAQVSGKLLSVNFTEGTDVKAGDVLAVIDPTPYRAALEQAEGAMRRDQAALAEARRDLERFSALNKANAISVQQYQAQEALVRQDEGVVESDRGTVEMANTNLNWTRIIAPISGRVGVRTVDPGNLVSANGSTSNTPATAASTNSSNPTQTGGTGIVIINQIQPIAVTFTVPEGEFQALDEASNGFSVPLTTRAYSQETGQLLGTGELSIVDNRVDPSTGTVELKARFPNTDRRLWPGQFVNVQLTLHTVHNATTIPITAVNRGPNGSFVYVVAKNGHVAARAVTFRPATDALALIDNGIRPGEVVVTDGQMSLKTGSLVRIANAAPRRRRT
jgi:multidrug efflux system membrane fusion protein